MVMGSDAVEVVRVAATPVLLVSKRGSRGPSLPDEEQPKE